MIVFKEKQYSTPVGRAIYRTLRVAGQGQFKAGRNAIRVKRVLNDQANVTLKNPISTVAGTVIPVPGATAFTTNTIGRYLETPALSRVAPGYGRRVNNFVNRYI